ncbi:MAG TPA: ATP-binding cassette domain-containing protein [Acidobacteriaceae bacterium]|jgi:phospholipid/cholesterol/gamma-HCH transport system ATP-binding protein
MPATLQETAPSRFQPKPGELPVVFEDVSISFDRNEVLKNISFQVKSGETRLLLGPAGGGKSVLLKLANGLIRPDSGRIFIFGHEITAMHENEIFELRSAVGMVFQEGALFDSMNIRDNVGFRLMEEHVPDEEIDRRVEEALKFVELDKTMEKFPSQLSGGMRRRVAIARAIIAKPSLLLYDSPTGGLDPITSTNIIALIMKQRDVYHTSSILITHRLQDAFMLATHYFDRDKNTMVALPSGEADRDTTFLVLHQGRLAFDGSTHDLVHSDDPFLKDYLS